MRRTVLLLLLLHSPAKALLPARLWTPCEIVWDSTIRLALKSLRGSNKALLSFKTDATIQSSLHALNTCYDPSLNYVSLTLVGSKVGDPFDEINQDRGFIYRVSATDAANSRSADTSTVLLAGVLDGHGDAGHYVAEQVKYELISRFEKEHPRNEVSNWLTSTIVDIDRNLPEPVAVSGGCTLSMAMIIGDNIYLCNTGDAQTLLVAATTSSKENELTDVQVVHATQLHTPDDPEERKRLEAAGMAIDTEENRAWYVKDGSHYGLAMSRALGDRDAGKAILATPTITQMSIRNVTEAAALATDCQELDLEGNVVMGEECSNADRVHLFAVSATDGLMDYLELDAIAYQLAQALYEDEKHLVMTTEDLVHQAAAQWQKEMHGTYRDDITITVVQIS